MFSRTLLCLALTLAATPALADTVWLKNGDRLTGKIKFYDGGKLLLVTNVAHLMPAELCSATRHNYRARPAGLKGATAAMSVVQRLRLYV